MSRPEGSKNLGEGITRTDFAKQTGWSITKVHEMCRAGLIPLLRDPSKPMRTWKIDPKVLETMANAGRAMQQEDDHPPLRATADPKVALHGQTTGDVADYWKARAKKEAANADLAALKLQQEQEKLLERDDVEDMLFEMARMTRDRVLAVPDRLNLPRMERVALRKELEAALEGLCEDIHGLTGYAAVDDADQNA